MAEPERPSANDIFVEQMRAEHPELAVTIPIDCATCSTAWLMALHGRIDRLAGCSGHYESIVGSEDIGQLTLKLCHMPEKNMSPE